MCVTWKRNVLLETAVLFAERWRHLTYSNEPNLLQCASLACWQCGWRTEAPSKGLRKYHRRERTATRRKTARRQKTDSHVDFLNLIVDSSFEYKITQIVVVMLFLFHVGNKRYCFVICFVLLYCLNYHCYTILIMFIIGP